MIDSSIIDQLKTVFQSLSGSIELLVAPCDHPKQSELTDMLEQVSATSGNITVREGGDPSQTPRFDVNRDGKPCGIRFTGIPGGHEFTSLVLSILNADMKGKLPDEVILSRIRRLKGPVHVKTYVSLSCENCPEVVQALNIMAAVHPGFSHEMVDGAFVQDEVSALGIQGVPSVMHDNTLVSSGKTDLIGLLAKLEEHVGVEEAAPQEAIDLGAFDVAVVGGGPAGASAAIYSARKGLKTVIVAETFGGQVKETKGIENMISIPYTEGPELADRLMKHVAEYDIKVLEHRRLSRIDNNGSKALALDSGEHLDARAVIVATGAKWKELDVPGEKEYIGRGVAFCPHCDGPYYKGKDIAVIGGGNSGIEAAIDLAGIVRSVTVIEFLPQLKADKVLTDKLGTLSNVTVIRNAKTLEIIGNGDKVTGISYMDRGTEKQKQLSLDGVFVQIGLLPNSDCVKDLVETNTYGEIVVDDACRTGVKGIYAAGDVTTVPYKQIVISMGEGAKAALTAFEDLVLLG